MNIAGYRKTVITTTDKVQIILMLFEGALNHLKITKNKIQVGDIISKGIHLSKATAIISELSNVLDMEKGGEISRNLRGLYDFTLKRMLYANLHNDVKALEEAEKVIITLKDGWKEMMNEMKQQPAMAR